MRPLNVPLVLQLLAVTGLLGPGCTDLMSPDDDDGSPCIPTVVTELDCAGLDTDCDGVIDEFSFELCDGLDNDCDGVVDNGQVQVDPAFSDADSDGFSPCTGDCQDGDPVVHPDAAEAIDAKDNDCDSYGDEEAGVRWDLLSRVLLPPGREAGVVVLGSGMPQVWAGGEGCISFADIDALSEDSTLPCHLLPAIDPPPEGRFRLEAAWSSEPPASAGVVATWSGERPLWDALPSLSLLVSHAGDGLIELIDISDSFSSSSSLDPEQIGTLATTLPSGASAISSLIAAATRNEVIVGAIGGEPRTLPLPAVEAPPEIGTPLLLLPGCDVDGDARDELLVWYGDPDGHLDSATFASYEAGDGPLELEHHWSWDSGYGPVPSPAVFPPYAEVACVRGWGGTGSASVSAMVLGAGWYFDGQEPGLALVRVSETDTSADYDLELVPTASLDDEWILPEMVCAPGDINGDGADDLVGWLPGGSSAWLLDGASLSSSPASLLETIVFSWRAPDDGILGVYCAAEEAEPRVLLLATAIDARTLVRLL